jgi:multiple sugar transport system ATP-binding protein
MPVVELRGVTKIYARGQRAVDRVSLGISDGELLVLVGPSGCGKSTLLRMVAGLEEVTEGQILIGPRVVNEVPPKDRDIAMVFQNYALYPHMSVLDNMAFGLRRRKVPETDVQRRVRDTARTLGLETYLDRKPRELSGGERQRVALGRAMVRDPQVFLFDEPLSNLDAKLRVQVRAEIKRLHQRVPATMIYVTHDQVEAMTLGDRIAVLRGGVLQQVADPFELYRRPANQFVAGFIGSPPINFFAATSRGEGGDQWDASGVALHVPQPFAAHLSAWRGSRVILGIRPEDVGLVPLGSGVALSGTVEVREPLGNEVLVHWSTPVGELVSRLTGDRVPQVGERAELHLPYGKLHWFDPATERALDGSGLPG